MRLYGAGRPGFAGTGNGSWGAMMGRARDGTVASLNRIQAACAQYGLRATSRPLHNRWAVYRPLTEEIIAVIDIRDIADGEVDETVTQWVLAESFGTTLS